MGDFPQEVGDEHLDVLTDEVRPLGVESSFELKILPSYLNVSPADKLWVENLINLPNVAATATFFGTHTLDSGHRVLLVRDIIIGERITKACGVELLANANLAWNEAVESQISAKFSGNSILMSYSDFVSRVKRSAITDAVRILRDSYIKSPDSKSITLDEIKGTALKRGITITHELNGLAIPAHLAIIAGAVGFGMRVLTKTPYLLDSTGRSPEDFPEFCKRAGRKYMLNLDAKRLSGIELSAFAVSLQQSNNRILRFENKPEA